MANWLMISLAQTAGEPRLRRPLAPPFWLPTKSTAKSGPG